LARHKELARSGVNGLRDLIAALHWVRKNIAAVGGDPGSVTLMGESAGGKNICALATSPAARGLFKRIAVHSGGGQTVFASPDDAAQVTRAFVSAAGLEMNEASRLASMPAMGLIAAQTELIKTWRSGFAFRPTLDQEVLPSRPVDAAAAGAMANVHMIIGTCRDEAALFIHGAQAEQPFQSRQLAHVGLDVMQGLEQRYAESFPTMPLAERRIRQLTAEEYWMPSIRFAEAAHVKSGGKGWMYRFDHGTPSGPASGFAFHGADVPFIFNAVSPSANGLAASVDQLLAQQSHELWGTWASQGVAAIQGVQCWPEYELQRRSVLKIDRECAIEDDPRGDERCIWQDIL
jgi:para-nitrobenzyl esterase